MEEVTVTKLQLDVVNAYMEGQSMKEIALAVGVSYSRVINIFNAILIKARCATKKELLLKAKDIKWVLK